MNQSSNNQKRTAQAVRFLILIHTFACVRPRLAYHYLCSEDQQTKKPVADRELQARNFSRGEIESEDLILP